VRDLAETHYTRSPDRTSLAYQVSGDGPLDLVVTSSTHVPLDLVRDDPGFIRFSNRLGTFSRTVWFEPRGFGASICADCTHPGRSPRCCHARASPRLVDLPDRRERDLGDGRHVQKHGGSLAM